MGHILFHEISGTVCEYLVKHHAMFHLSAGELLREEWKRGGSSEQSRILNECMSSNNIVPVAITCTLLEQAMLKILDEHENCKGFLIDGFPRYENP